MSLMKGSFDWYFNYSLKYFVMKGQHKPARRNAAGHAAPHHRPERATYLI
jgi:hypothetical protein